MIILLIFLTSSIFLFPSVDGSTECEKYTDPKECNSMLDCASVFVAEGKGRQCKQIDEACNTQKNWGDCDDMGKWVCGWDAEHPRCTMCQGAERVCGSGDKCAWEAEECVPLKKSCQMQKSEDACNKIGAEKCVWELSKCRTYIGSCKERKTKEGCNENAECGWDGKECLDYIKICKEQKNEDGCNEKGAEKCVWEEAECRTYKGSCNERKTEDGCNEMGAEKCVWELSKCRTYKGSCKEGKTEDGCKEITGCVWETKWNKKELKYKAECRTFEGSCKKLNELSKCKTNDDGMPCIWNGLMKVPECLPLNDICHLFGDSSYSVCKSIWKCEWKNNECTIKESSK